MPLLVQIVTSRGFGICVHLALWVLVFFAATSFGGKSSPLRDSVALSAPAQSPVPVAKLDRQFSPGIWPRLGPDTNATSLFFTRHFIPAPPPPTPPPPTTRKIPIVYLGFYQTDGPRSAIVKLTNTFVVHPIGAHVSTNWFIADATYQTLTLTNVAGQTNVLPLNAKKEIEVPVP